MIKRIGAAFVGLALAVPAQAEAPLEQGFAGSLRGCEEWVLNPASWADGVEPFVATVGLGNRMGLVKSVNEAALPPEGLRAGNHYWRINSTDDAGFILVVSDRLPMCHITGGGGSDLQPFVETVLSGDEFLLRWEKMDDDRHGDMVSTTFKNREDARFSMVVSRADSPGQRVDRVQVIATAMFDTSG
ncbi:hypothetical protein [Croceicoccus gelatinilyticus]|uniref:hypothetical protein n=1 Tax=Croceicoccus gelatinilyticus TaxID=2835536 RepID=UPI001BCEAE5C|nr:hypothetical protein [Croceicoccus gelatinilyticus]MBS7669232.1 hypothetical protein [Croceicoccus gelatinilyticus]